MNEKQKEALVKELYEKYPYPSRIVTSKEEISYFAQWVAKTFDEDAGYWKGKTVLELGCGTGELACALALSGAKITAIDFSLSSIKKARGLAKKLGVAKKTKFIEKNILNIKEDEFGGKFDCVIALGSLHHTINAKKGFEIGCANLKKGGIIVIGLYNKYARMRHRARRVFLRAFAGNNIDKRIAFGEKLFGSNKNKFWAADKYGQVHESYHSVSEINKWFKGEKIEFISSRPRIKTPRIGELKWLFEKKGAFFVMVGCKKD